jgi:transposase
MPYGKKLTDTEIAARMTELRNLRKLHAHDRKQIVALKLRVKTLEQEKADDRAYFESLIQKQAIQIAELQTVVFGRKKRGPMGGTPIATGPLVKQARTKASYRRPLPPASAVTSEVAVPLPETCACGGSFDLEKITIHDRYEEDIPLPELTPGYQAKLVTKYVIERGICLACGKAATGEGRNLGGQAVTLGPNVRLLVAHLVSVLSMSYTQVTNLLLSLYGLTVSGGEIAAMLQDKHQAWLPAYNQLKTNIRAVPVVHTDETPWPIQDLQGLGHAWVLADASSPSVCYDLVTSRGAPHAQALLGRGTDQAFAGIRISDDYGPYRNPELPGTQQLCWAHLYCAIRDLRYNTNLPEEQLPYVENWYAGFAGIYQDLRQYLGEPYDEVVREQQATELWQRVQTLANHMPPNNHGEPDKLTRLKVQLLRAGQDRLFVCLPKNTPCDNNRAERDLRQLVLKRKRSFGSQTEKGAKALATILSVCTTTWRIQPQGYFQQLALLG